MVFLIKFLIYLNFIQFALAIRQGYTASPGDVPYQVSIEYRGHHICSGALTVAGSGEQIVLTTATCVMYPHPSKKVYPAVALRVLAGRVRLDRRYGCEQKINVRRVRYHRGLWRPSNENNIAVLFLEQPFNVTRIVKPIRLPGPRDVYPENFLVSGWGHQNSSQTVPTKKLKLVQQFGIDHTYCYNRYYRYYWQWAVFPSTVCMGGDTGNYYGACEGDEGSPAIAVHEDDAYLGGIYIWKRGVSGKCASLAGLLYRTFAYVCNKRNTVWCIFKYNSIALEDCDGDWPAIYADMFYFVKWVDIVTLEPNSTTDGYGR